MDKIQLFVPNFRIEECLAQVRECLEKGWTGLGFKTNEFEDAWKSLYRPDQRPFPELGDLGPAHGAEIVQGGGRLG